MSTPSIPINRDDVVQAVSAIQHASPLLVFLFDHDDRLQYANLAFQQLFALSPDATPTWAELMMHCHTNRVGALIETTDLSAWLASARSRRGKEPYRAFEADMCDGRWMWITETLRSDGWMLCVGSDITALKANSRALRQSRDMALRSAQTDSLTGISNRQHLTDQIEKQLELLRKRDQLCGIALIDLDEFKTINDRFGHLGGDSVLRHFARTVQSTLRHEDGFGRIGGEEFLLLLPRSDAGSMERVIGRITDILSTACALADQPGFRYTFSAGLSMLRPTDTMSSAYKRVDEAMYRAKADGRNAFRWAQT